MLAANTRRKFKDKFTNIESYQLQDCLLAILLLSSRNGSWGCGSLNNVFVHKAVFLCIEMYMLQLHKTGLASEIRTKSVCVT